MLDSSVKSVLIIEDDLDYRNRLKDFLSAHGLNVFFGDNGEQAMEKLLFYRPQLIILDLMLPKVDGFEVLHRIRSYPEEDVVNVPIIILSNLSSNQDIEKAQKYNITDYFVKSETPFNQVLEKAIEILFKGHKPPQNELLDFRDVT